MEVGIVLVNHRIILSEKILEILKQVLYKNLNITWNNFEVEFTKYRISTYPIIKYTGYNIISLKNFGSTSRIGRVWAIFVKMVKNSRLWICRQISGDLWLLTLKRSNFAHFRARDLIVFCWWSYIYHVFALWL